MAGQSSSSTLRSPRRTDPLTRASGTGESSLVFGNGAEYIHAAGQVPQRLGGTLVAELPRHVEALRRRRASQDTRSEDALPDVQHVVRRDLGLGGDRDLRRQRPRGTSVEPREPHRTPRSAVRALMDRVADPDRAGSIGRHGLDVEALVAPAPWREVREARSGRLLGHTPDAIAPSARSPRPAAPAGPGRRTSSRPRNSTSRASGKVASSRRARSILKNGSAGAQQSSTGLSNAGSRVATSARSQGARRGRRP